MSVNHYCRVAMRSGPGSCEDCAGCRALAEGAPVKRLHPARVTKPRTRGQKAAMIPDELLADADDVHVRDVDAEWCECGAPVTHQVTIDLRAAGTEVPVDRGCQRCMNAYAKRVRRGLPKARRTR